MTKLQSISTRNSIATKLLKKVFLGYIVFALTITGIHMLMEYRRVKGELIVELNTLHATFGKPMAIAVWDADKDQISSILEGLVGTGIIHGVTVTETEGEIIQQAGSVVAPEKRREIKDELGIRLEGLDNQSDLFGYRYPINYSETNTPNPLGHVTLFTSQLIVLNKIKHQFFHIILTECVKAFILWLVFLCYGKRLLTWPLSVLAEKASEISMDNLQPIRLNSPDKTRNEVTVLQNAFNTMVNNLLKGVQKQRALYAELDSFKNNLQLLVNQRTKELRKTNNDLLAQIKERKEAEGKLNQYGKILENSLNEIYVFDSKHLTFLKVNEGARKNLGYTSKQLEKLTPVDIIPTFSTKTFEEMVIPLRMNEEELLIFEAIHRRKDASTYDVEVHIQLMNFPGMEVFVAIILDISEKKLLEKQLRQAQKMEAIGTLAGGIAHDFNNLLMGVQGRASLMRTNLDLSDVNYESIKEIEDYAGKAKSLTQQLLGIARGGKYNPTPVKLYDLATDSLTMFGRTRKEITITTESHDKEVIVEVDQNQIELVLLNIFLNAWQSMSQAGRIHLKTGTASLDKHMVKDYMKPAEAYAMISITDNGSGMDEATLSQVFNPFFTTKDRERGTGLGMASAYGIIKNHQGFITVDSKIGHGSTFSIYLPISERPAIKQNAPEADINMGEGKILLVDDEQMILDVAGAMLLELGFEVVTARGGQKAVDAMGGDSVFDLVILDLVMPDMDGNETFDLIKKINPRQLILLSSGYSIDGKATEILDKGCCGFIQKPFGISEISQMIKKVLSKAKLKSVAEGVALFRHP